MTWKCYGWYGQYCHTGRDYFISDPDGVCVENPDRDYEPDTYPFKVCFVVLNPPDARRLNRKLISFFEGEEFYRYNMNNNHCWAHIETTLYNDNNRGLYSYELQDGDDNVLCRRSVYIGDLTEEVPVIDEPEVSDIDYDKIVEGVALLVNAAHQESMGGIKDNLNAIEGVGDQINDTRTSLSSEISDVSFEVSKTGGTIIGYLHNELKGVSESLTGGISGVSDKIEGLKFPSIEGIKEAFLSVCEDLAQSLWDAILDRIESRYPKDEDRRD